MKKFFHLFTLCIFLSAGIVTSVSARLIKLVTMSPLAASPAWLVKPGALPLIGTTDEKGSGISPRPFTIDLDHQDWYELYAASRGRAVMVSGEW